MKETQPIASVNKPANSGLAIVSLVCGILGFGCVFFTGIPAIITGHMALSRIKASNGTIGGEGLALAGTILGYITTFIFGTIAVIALITGLATPVILKAKKEADHAKTISEMSLIGLDLDEFAATDGRYPNAEEFLVVTELPEVPRSMEGTWVYFPDADPNEMVPLLISPFTNNKAAVLFTDIHVESLDSDEVVEILQTSDAEPFEIEVIKKAKKK